MKIVVVGPRRAGKTCSIRRLVDEKAIQAPYCPTVGCETTPVNVEVGGEMRQVMLWDTAGVRGLGGLLDGAYFEARGALVFTSGDASEDIARIEDLHRVAPNAVVHYVTTDRRAYSGTHLGKKRTLA